MPTENESHDAPVREFLPAERQDAILGLLTRQPVVRVPELAQLLNTTEITIRRDLAQLSDAGLLKRIRGGAMSVNTTTASDDTTQRETDNVFLTREAERMPGGTIGIMFPEPSFFWPRANAALVEASAREGFTISSTESTYEPIEETRQLDALAAIPDLVGLILAPNSHKTVARNTWQWIRDSDIPTVIVERTQPAHMDFFADSVCTDHPNGARKAYWHFVEQGHTRVGAVFSQTPTSKLIERGWREAVEDNDALASPIIEHGIQPYEVDRIESLVNRIIREQITGMLAHSDYLAIALIQALQRHGVQVPGDVSIISVDGFATMSSRPLTSLRSFPETLAAESLALLQWRLRHPHATARHLWIDPELVDRGSVVRRTEG